MMFLTDRITLTTALLEGNYPNYEQVIPTKFMKEIEIDKEALGKTMRRMAIMTSEKTNAVKFEFSNGKIVLSSQTPDMGEGVEEIETAYKGEDITISFNPGYVLDVLKNIEDEKINFKITDSCGAGEIIPGDHEKRYINIIMPIKLS